MHSWVDKNLGKQGAKDAIRVAVAMVLGCEPSQVSVLSFTWYVAVAGSVQQVRDIYPLARVFFFGCIIIEVDLYTLSNAKL